MKLEGIILWKKWQSAKKRADELRKIVDDYKRELLTKGNYVNHRTGERILDPKYDWLMSQKEAEEFYETVEKEMTARGLREGLEKDFCPALVAENVVMGINREIITWTAKLIGEGEKFIEGVYRNMKIYAEVIALFNQLHQGK
jgi:hypothetical protein